MSFAKLDDALTDHPKVFAAAADIGANGPAITIGFFAVAIMWCNKHLTDGFIARDVVRTLPHVQKPLLVADALAKAGLLERATKNGKAGFLIHDFGDYNWAASAVKEKRRADRDRLRKKRNGQG